MTHNFIIKISLKYLTVKAAENMIALIVMIPISAT